jgi:hypothetical protein
MQQEKPITRPQGKGSGEGELLAQRVALKRWSNRSQDDYRISVGWCRSSSGIAHASSECSRTDEGAREATLHDRDELLFPKGDR